MRILNISKLDFGFKGGIEKEAKELSSQLAAILDVDTLCFGKKNIEQSISTNERCFVFRSRRLLGKIDISIHYVIFLIRKREKYDYIWLHYPNILPAILLYLLRPKIPIILHWHNDIMVLPTFYQIFKPIETWLVKNSVRIVTTSPDYYRYSSAICDYSSKIESIPICIANVPTKPVIRNSPQNPINIITIGRYTPYKGYYDLIKLVKDLPRVKLDLVTSSTLPQNLRSKIESAKNVILHQNITDDCLTDLLMKSDVYVMSSLSRNEGYGIVLLEALRVGLPICVNYVPGTGSSYIVRPGHNGEFYNLKDKSDFNASLQKIIHPNRFYMYQQNALEDFKSRFELKKNVSPYLDFFIKNFTNTERVSVDHN